MVHLDYPSVGATENIMMAGVLASGTTTILNAAKEPEIVDLAAFINSIGGRIVGAGSSTIVVTGVAALGGGEYQPISDRIVTGTYLIAAAMTGGKLTLKNANFENVFSLINKLRNSGCKIDFNRDTINIEATARPAAITSIETQPYPGFPTDLQAQVMAMCAISDGISVITENLFETRFKHVPELKKMGANITVRDRMAIVRGVKNCAAQRSTQPTFAAGQALFLRGCAHGARRLLTTSNMLTAGTLKWKKSLITSAPR